MVEENDIAKKEKNSKIKKGKNVKIRKRKIMIEQKIIDPVINKLKNMDKKEIIQERKVIESNLSSSINHIFTQAQILSAEHLIESRDDLTEIGLYTLQEAYDKIRKSGINISFRAFGGRIERGSIETIKIKNKRFIAEPILDDFINIHQEFMSIKQAYESLKKFNESNYRAFIGRIEKGIIPSVKIGTKRFIPKEAIQAQAYINKNYYTVKELSQELNKRGVKIKRNALERRLDRKRIPFEKIGGKRFIPKTILNNMITQENEKKNR